MTTNAKSKKIEKKDILELAERAVIQITEAEIEKLESALTETLDYIENLDELNTSEVEKRIPTHKNISFADGTISDRTLSQEKALENAPKKSDGFFIVNKILEK